MDIGSEISEKIQLAIKAKLVEINAYVDDELPDYIMIMIANRKPEEQMADALSLFLSDNAKSFTKWLYELLGSLRKKSGNKNDSELSTTTKIEPRAKTVDDPVDNAAQQEASPVLKPEPPPKTSRWDVKKHIKRKSATLVVETSAKDNDANASTTHDTTIVTKEAVIDILPEKDDLFDEELLSDNKELAPNESSRKNLPKSKATVAPVAKSAIKAILVDKVYERSKVSSVKKSSSAKTLEKKQKVDNEIDETSRQQALNTSDKAKQDFSTSHHKRSVAVKSVKESIRKVSTTDKEFASQFAPTKSKKKKLKRSKEKESAATSAEKFTQKHVREWDKRKGREPLTYNDSSTRKSSQPDKVEKISVKSRVSQVASTISVAKEHQYESEDSDENPVHSSVISKVAVPPRRSRLPPSKQANRSLLLKAVSEAESSIKHFLANRAIEPVSEETFKSRVEKHKRSALGSVLEKKTSQGQENSRKLVSSRLLRDTNLLRSSKSEKTKKDDILAKKVPQKRKSQPDIPENEKLDNISDQNRQPYGDSRRIVPRDQGESESIKSRKLIRRSKDVENVGVSHDTRKLMVKELPADNAIKQESSGDEDDDSGEQISDEDKRKSFEKLSRKSRKRRPSSPCFIVTLDGSSNKNEELPLKKKSHSTSDKTDQAKKTSTEKKSEPVLTKSDVKPVDEAIDKTTAAEKSKSVGDETTLSERELENMREKLLAMQEKAKKLKEIQSKRQEMLQKKLNNGQAVVKSNNKLIHIANVHFSATENQLSEHFSICGKVAKATILKDFSGHPKG